MKRIKDYKKFVEAVSGTLANVYGPGLPRPEYRNTISSGDTEVLFDDATDRIYSRDEYDDMYKDYITKGGEPLPDGFNMENLQKVILKNKE